MKKIFIVCLFLFSTIYSQTELKHLNNNLSMAERVDFLIKNMTLSEKISQLGYDSPAIERLKIQKYNWWNECLHGVARNGLATVFPQAIGLAATWDNNLIYEVAKVISEEARAKYNFAVKNNQRNIYQGLTFWTPNINIFRDPRWGRGMETYGEDPYLTGSIAVQFIRGLQGDHPKYLKAIATAKHFAVHSGPEPDRHSFNAVVSEYDLHETYLPAFKMSVQKANVQSIMCAYNSLYGIACCSNNQLIDQILRKDWKFNGYVVSDCWAISDIYQFHKQTPNAAEASALSVKAGTDLECGASYPSLNEAVKDKKIDESQIDISLRRLLEAKIKLGMFDPEEQVPFSKIDIKVLNSQRHKEIAELAAKKSIVLLKNEKKTLPLSKKIKTLAVIGPNSNDEETLMSNYNGTPANPITPLNGIKNKVGANTIVLYEKGCDLAENMPAFDLVPAACLYTSNDKRVNGIKRELFDNSNWNGNPTETKIDSVVDYKNLVSSFDLTGKLSARWSGYLVPKISGDYYLGAYGFNGFKIFIEDSLLVESYSDNHSVKAYKKLNLTEGKAYKIRVDFYSSAGYSEMQLLWSVPDPEAVERAVKLAKQSDAVVMFMGLSPRLEGEEMNVPVKGFAGGDRTSLDLPDVQDNLIKKIVAVGKPTILVLLNGSALSINWANDNVDAIIESWYGGQAAGNAIADVLFGDYNPSGKLPVTFYKSVTQLPDFKDYNMRSNNSNGRTYRYFKGDVIYPFGHGLSYSNFEISKATPDKNYLCENDSIIISVDVKNINEIEGEEVIQLYVKGKNENSAIKTLKGFMRVELKGNQSENVRFAINRETLAEFIDGKGFTVEKGVHTLLIGKSSADSKMKKIEITVD